MSTIMLTRMMAVMLFLTSSTSVANASRVSAIHHYPPARNDHFLGETSTRHAYKYSGVKKGAPGGPPGSFGYVGLSFSLMPFLPPDQNITLSLTNSELWAGEWDTPPEQKLYPVRSTIGNSLMGFRAVGDGTAAPSTLRVNGTVTYQWTSNDTQTHKLSFFFNSYASMANIHTEWYVPGYEATTLGVGIGQDLAYSIIYAAGDSPPVPP